MIRDEEELISELSIKTGSKLVLLVIDGLGGLPVNGKTSLEKAKTPNLDELARKSACGLGHPVAAGITPGSGPGHLAVFGYNPLKYEIGRGVLEALGVGISLTSDDLACRANFSTRDKQGIITDRRAGRIPTEVNQKLCAELQKKIKKIRDVEVLIHAGREHRFVIVFRGKGLEGPLPDTDPQQTGLKPVLLEAKEKKFEKSVSIINEFIEAANQVLKDHFPANTFLMRGIAKVPPIPSMKNLYKLDAAAIATYPMYRGLARLVGMDILETGETIADEFKCLKENYGKYDFFYLHIKKVDSYGEDGNFEQKVKVIEEVDRNLPVLLDLKPDVLVVTADHSTPCPLKAHSWHPVPYLLSSKYVRPDQVRAFSESECSRGILGHFNLKENLPLMMANGLKLKKFGA